MTELRSGKTDFAASCRGRGAPARETAARLSALATG